MRVTLMSAIMPPAADLGQVFRGLLGAQFTSATRALGLEMSAQYENSSSYTVRAPRLRVASMRHLLLAL